MKINGTRFWTESSAAKSKYAEAKSRGCAKCVYRWNLCVIVAAALVAAEPWAEAGNLHKVWELRLDSIIKEPALSASASSDTVNAVKFSPDGRRLAVAVHIHHKENYHSCHLLILDSDLPRTANLRFELAQGLLPVDDGDRGLLWSPDGKSIVALETIVSLLDGRACNFPFGGWAGGYLNNEMLVERITDERVGQKTSRFVLATPQCRVQDTWNVDEAWLIQDVSATRGLALVEQFVPLQLPDPFGAPRGATLLVDFQRKHVLRHWTARNLLPDQVRFAEDGKSLCAAAGGVKQHAAPVRCFDVDTGNLIAETSEIKRGWSLVAASESSRVVITQYRWQLEDQPTTPVLSRRIVWDFRTGKQIVTWRPEFQKWLLPSSKIALQRQSPYVFAISPNGKYIAEGGNNILRLYEIVP